MKKIMLLLLFVVCVSDAFFQERFTPPKMAAIGDTGSCGVCYVDDFDFTHYYACDGRKSSCAWIICRKTIAGSTWSVCTLSVDVDDAFFTPKNYHWPDTAWYDSVAGENGGP